MKTTNAYVEKGYSTIKLNDLGKFCEGKVYTIKMRSGKDVFVEQILLTIKLQG